MKVQLVSVPLTSSLVLAMFSTQRVAGFVAKEAFRANNIRAISSTRVFLAKEGQAEGS